MSHVCSVLITLSTYCTLLTHSSSGMSKSFAASMVDLQVRIKCDSSFVIRTVTRLVVPPAASRLDPKSILLAQFAGCHWGPFQAVLFIFLAALRVTRLQWLKEDVGKLMRQDLHTQEYHNAQRRLVCFMSGCGRSTRMHPPTKRCACKLNNGTHKRACTATIPPSPPILRLMFLKPVTRSILSTATQLCPSARVWCGFTGNVHANPMLHVQFKDMKSLEEGKNTLVSHFAAQLKNTAAAVTITKLEDELTQCDW